MKVIALDAGHGLSTAGKRTPDGILEWSLNDKVRDKVANYLSEYDCKTIYPDNNEGRVDESLSSRRSMYVVADADAAVSIHHNAFTSNWSDTVTGVETYVDKNCTAADLQLAETIQKKLTEYTGLRNRGVKKANFTVINQNSVPAVLVEGGFMDSTIDYPVITSETGQNAYARAVAEGLIEYLKLKKKTATPKPTQPAQTVQKGSGYMFEPKTVKYGSEGASVLLLQRLLRALGYKGKDGKVLSLDGDAKTNTVYAINSYQSARRKQGVELGTNGANDGACGKKMWKDLIGL